MRRSMTPARKESSAFGNPPYLHFPPYDMLVKTVWELAFSTIFFARIWRDDNEISWHLCLAEIRE